MEFSPLEPDDYRQVIGKFPTGVAVVTTSTPSGPAGLTTNAVSSLSLEPLLMIVCFDTSSRTLSSVASAGRFGVSILAADQEPIARTFAGKQTGHEKLNASSHRWHGEVPIIDDCSAWLVCDLQELLERGDHTIAIGAVRAGGADETRSPLLYLSGAYQQSV